MLLFPLSFLKPCQLGVIKHTHPQLILAGTSKTKTITARIAYMIEKEGIDSSILALTFSREAARNIQINVAPLIRV